MTKPSPETLVWGKQRRILCQSVLYSTREYGLSNLPNHRIDGYP
jgi:hypothetical protein